MGKKYVRDVLGDPNWTNLLTMEADVAATWKIVDVFQLDKKLAIITADGRLGRGLSTFPVRDAQLRQAILNRLRPGLEVGEALVTPIEFKRSARR